MSALKLTPENARAFLITLAETGQVSKAHKAIGVSRQTVYDWREAFPDFKEAWDKAKELSADLLEDEAFRRGHDGYEDLVFTKDGVETVTKYSDTLLIFLLKGAKPDKYKDRVAQELTGKDGGPIVSSDADAAKEIAAIIDAAKKRDASDLA